MNTTKFLVVTELIFKWGIYRQLTKNTHIYTIECQVISAIKQVREQGVTKGCSGSGDQGRPDQRGHI